MADAPDLQTAEQTETTRRSFLKWMAGALSAMIGLVLGIPSLRAIINSAPLQRLSYVEVGDISALSIGQPKDMNFQMVSADAYLRQEVTQSVWVVKNSSAVSRYFRRPAPTSDAISRGIPGPGISNAPATPASLLSMGRWLPARHRVHSIRYLTRSRTAGFTSSGSGSKSAHLRR